MLYFYYETMKYKPDWKYTPMNFIAKMRYLGGNKMLNTLFGRQMNEFNCYHRSLDLLSKVYTNKEVLHDNYGKYPLSGDVFNGVASSLEVRDA